jgi:serine/threonine-protein kinase CTR1
VYEGDWRGIRVAVKSLMKSFDEDSVQYRDFIREINLISGLRHPNLVTFLGVEVDAEPPCIVSELMEGGSIEDLYSRKVCRTLDPERAI